MATNEAMVIVDVQRGFSEADLKHSKEDGFGELAVPGAHDIIRVINKLAVFCAANGIEIDTTQDGHPPRTAHFANRGEEPNNKDTWPRHCVWGTPGAYLHPGLKLPSAHHFIKGTTSLLPGDVDDSYTGYNARSLETGQLMPEWFEDRGITKLRIVGLALDKCVRATAMDYRNNGFEVSVALDATRGIDYDACAHTVVDFNAADIELATSDLWMRELATEI